MLLIHWDQIWFNYLYNLIHHPLLDLAMSSLSLVGSLGLVWILISIVVFSKKGRYRHLLSILLALILIAILNEFCIKQVFNRPRPFTEFTRVLWEIKFLGESHLAFPSGHSVTSFTMATILAHYFKRSAPLLFTLATLISISRIYLGKHYPLDILAGLIIGLSYGKLFTYIFDKKQKLLIELTNK